MYKKSSKIPRFTHVKLTMNIQFEISIDVKLRYCQFLAIFPAILSSISNMFHSSKFLTLLYRLLSFIRALEVNGEFELRFPLWQTATNWSLVISGTNQNNRWPRRMRSARRIIYQPSIPNEIYDGV